MAFFCTPQKKCQDPSQTPKTKATYTSSRWHSAFVRRTGSHTVGEWTGPWLCFCHYLRGWPAHPNSLLQLCHPTSTVPRAPAASSLCICVQGLDSRACRRVMSSLYRCAKRCSPAQLSFEQLPLRPGLTFTGLQRHGHAQRGPRTPFARDVADLRGFSES